MGSLSTAISAVGNVAYNERDVVVVQARGNGFVEKLFVRAALDPVRKGQPLAELYVPDWIAAQEEYLEAKRLRTEVDALALGGLADAAAQRMRLAGMTDEQIREVEARGTVQRRFTITSPIDGVVGELSARDGMTIATGAPLFRLNGLATVWVYAEVPEGDAGAVRPGSTVQARSPAFPGSVFTGRVNAILPEVNPTTRTLKARIELANAGARLVPGMFATIDFAATQDKEGVLVPSEAVIRTGKRVVVIIAQGKGRFLPVDVETGAESNGRTEIRSGVRAGDDVVVSGQFLIDSEANLKASTTRMSEVPVAHDGTTAGQAAGGADGDDLPVMQDAPAHGQSAHGADAMHGHEHLMRAAPAEQPMHGMASSHEHSMQPAAGEHAMHGMASSHEHSMQPAPGEHAMHGMAGSHEHSMQRAPDEHEHVMPGTPRRAE
jgi:Cu(I)/Ag(I) efflux system membrane fusion protein